MVSIRRQRLIKLNGRSPLLDFLSPYENGQSPGSWVQSTKSACMHPSPLVDVDQPDDLEITKSEEPEPLIVNESSSSNKHPVQHPEFKKRKRHKRKVFENQEACIMRGVYYKNMKWQAAIKVDKKQIHLGTVRSQEEAAHLYDSPSRGGNFDPFTYKQADFGCVYPKRVKSANRRTRAAFMCGREPNFDLTIKEKNELSKLSWDDFLTMTRSAINKKRNQRRANARVKFEIHQQNNSDSEAVTDAEQLASQGSDD